MTEKKWVVVKGPSMEFTIPALADQSYYVWIYSTALYYRWRTEDGGFDFRLVYSLEPDCWEV